MDNRIEKYRKLLGLSQHRLGKKFGVTRTNINHIETGKTTPNLKLLNKIAQALDVSLHKIFDLNGKGSYKCPDNN